ncbi:MAG: DUF563 domain-containing protein [Rhodospirillaceae bacterium]|nr:DUF563 domain-containing protein [Rhodospirillaceae bacterium]
MHKELDLKFFNFPDKTSIIDAIDRLRFNTHELQLIRVEEAILSPARLRSVSEGDNSTSSPEPELRGGVYSRNGRLLRASLMNREIDLVASSDEAEIDSEFLNINKIISLGVYLGWYMTHHGHFLTESLSRLWCFEKFADNPNIKFIFHFSDRTGERKLRPDHAKILSLLGIPEQSVEFIEDWTSVDALFIPEQAQALNHFTHSNLAPAFNQIAEMASKSAANTPDKVYISRKNLNFFKIRPFNETEIENLMVSHGFSILYPEQTDIEEQIRTFKNAKVICGFYGSGLYNGLFSGTNAHIIVLTGDHSRLPPMHHFLISYLTKSRLTLLNCLVPLEYWRGVWLDGRVVDAFLCAEFEGLANAQTPWTWWPNPPDAANDMEHQIMFHHAVIAACDDRPERYRPLLQRLARYAKDTEAALDLIAEVWHLSRYDARRAELSRHLVSLSAWVLGIFDWEQAGDFEHAVTNKLKAVDLSNSSATAYADMYRACGFVTGIDAWNSPDSQSADLHSDDH